MANKCRLIVKAIGDFDFSRITTPTIPHLEASPALDSTSNYSVKAISSKISISENPSLSTGVLSTSSDISSYIPTIVLSPGKSNTSSLPDSTNYEWYLSEIDLEWITVGCYILGTGGGGTPYPHFLRLREMMRSAGATVRVVEPGWVGDEDVVGCGGCKGSPTVGIEKLPGDELMESQNILYDYLGIKPDVMIDLEIGGGNGLQGGLSVYVTEINGCSNLYSGLILGASTNMNIPVVDGDWMGRAYPVGWQITPVVWAGDHALFLPTTISDGNGNNMVSS